MTPPGTVPPSPSPSVQHLAALLAPSLLKDVFHGISPDRIPLSNVRRWKSLLPKHDRVAMVLSFMDNCGFSSFSEFLEVLFTDKGARQSTKVAVTKFLDKQLAIHPLHIIELMYSRRRSENFDIHGQRAAPPVLHSLPRHARARAERSRASLPVPDPHANPTRGDIADWALSNIVLPAVDREVGELLRPQHGLTLRKGARMT